MLVLGIETSCDETAAAIVRDGHEILSNVIYSQVQNAHALRRRCSGNRVARALAENQADRGSGVYEAGKTLDDIDGIAATSGPGLDRFAAGRLNVCQGAVVSEAKPLAAVNHIEGHIYSVSFEHPTAEFPAFALVVSGRAHKSCFGWNRNPAISGICDTTCRSNNGMTLQVKPTTRWRSFSVWVIRAVRSSIALRRAADAMPFGSRFQKSRMAHSTSVSAESRRPC